ncbi:hypothetical protein ASE40_16500 [Flavobacterium sp. Root935]|uniref:hypothetical protein n=1 Tax=Flavobacterium sp. Root935 TaxID=1736610 RepID=UPI00070F636E|nr:hypothetical protein [Flavobacterium sp. Root935]KRD57946.1 hypothetical protein ASE40_16500 [Flavobacterium sp. Root935]
MKLKSITIILFLISAISFGQQIADGRALEITDFSVPLRSGAYQGYLASGVNADQAFGWQHLFVVRHSNDGNNYQLQLSSSYSSNDRLFFRKIASGSAVSSNSEWNEVATRGANVFNGNQILVGNQILTGDLIIGKDLEISTISGPASSGAIQIKTNSGAGGSNNRYLRLGWKDNNASFIPALSINENLNVGIGTIDPDSKLSVNGTIHSKEVKVDMNGWSDFVFKKEYSLPTLEEVEKHITEKGHLENIPSEEEVLKNGINLGEMNAKLLQKIEELTLYMIGQNKKIEELKRENQNYKYMSERLSEIEKKLE